MIGFLPRQRDRKGLLAALPGYHMRQRLMSRAPWNKLRAGGSLISERWLSFPGQVAQSGPEYSRFLYSSSFLITLHCILKGISSYVLRII